MDAGTATEPQQLGSEAEADAVTDAVTAPRGKDGRPEVPPETEKSALDYLLQPPKKFEYTVPVKFETEGGEIDLRFVITSLSGQQLRSIEKRNTKDNQNGILPELDDARVSAETVAAALVRMEDPTTGRSISPSDPAFMVNARGERLTSTADAIAARFEFQSGILANLASEVRRISGWSSDRVGSAQRLMVDAVGSSSSGGD